MDNQRLVLFVVFAFSGFFLYQNWQRDRLAPPAPAPSSISANTVAGDVPAATPGLGGAAPAAMPAPAAASAVPASVAVAGAGKLLHVETDEVEADISTEGGDLRHLELRQHRDALDPAKNFVLFDQSDGHTYVAQSGLIGAGLPNHRTPYSSAAERYQMAEGADSLQVRLQAPAANGVSVTKVYTFHRGSYVIDIAYEIENRSAQPLQAEAYFQLVHDSTPPPGGARFAPSYTGFALYTEQEKFSKLPFKDLDKAATSHTSNDGWIAVLQHYFLAAWLPSGNTPRELSAEKLPSGLYVARVKLPTGVIAPGAAGTLSMPLYAGPQEQDKLAALAPGLDLSVDYGKLRFIAAPLFWALQWLHQWVGNWGLAIILLTVGIKALFYPLSAAGYRSMARMRALAPKLEKLKERYADDRQRQSQAMMELYKTEKINPLGGCLPMLVQIPVFISLYWMLQASVELRHAPFVLWIHDLAQPDPYYVLPVLMGASMLVQSMLSPPPPDPVQAKIMKIMPVAFSVFFFFFPAGLVLYSLLNNMLSILQQWRINHVIDRSGLRKPS